MTETTKNDSSKEMPKEMQVKEKSAATDGKCLQGDREVKTTSSSSSFEDFSSYRKEVSKEVVKVDSATSAAAKEREEKIKKLMKEQEAETARRIAEGIKFGTDSSESINTTCRRYGTKLKQAKNCSMGAQCKEEPNQGASKCNRKEPK